MHSSGRKYAAPARLRKEDVLFDCRQNNDFIPPVEGAVHRRPRCSPRCLASSIRCPCPPTKTWFCQKCRTTVPMSQREKHRAMEISTFTIQRMCLLLTAIQIPETDDAFEPRTVHCVSVFLRDSTLAMRTMVFVALFPVLLDVVTGEIYPTGR